jgi:hypothetical protein
MVELIGYLDIPALMYADRKDARRIAIVKTSLDLSYFSELISSNLKSARCSKLLECS